MRIKPQAGIQTRTEAASAAQAAEQAKARTAAVAAPPAAAAARSDSVEISDAGRAIAARGGVESLTPERSERIRQNVLEGAYSSLAVVDEVARRILGSGDLA